MRRKGRRRKRRRRRSSSDLQAPAPALTALQGEYHNKQKMSCFAQVGVKDWVGQSLDTHFP